MSTTKKPAFLRVSSVSHIRLWQDDGELWLYSRLTESEKFSEIEKSRASEGETRQIDG